MQNDNFGFRHERPKVEGLDLIMYPNKCLMNLTWKIDMDQWYSVHFPPWTRPQYLWDKGIQKSLQGEAKEIQALELTYIQVTHSTKI